MPPFLIPVSTRAHGHTVTKEHLTQCPDKENFTLTEGVCPNNLLHFDIRTSGVHESSVINENKYFTH